MISNDVLISPSFASEQCALAANDTCEPFAARRDRSKAWTSLPIATTASLSSWNQAFSCPFDQHRLLRFLEQGPEAKLPEVDTDELIAEVTRGAFNGMTPSDITRALVLAARIERDPAYDALAAQL